MTVACEGLNEFVTSSPPYLPKSWRAYSSTCGLLDSTMSADSRRSRRGRQIPLSPVARRSTNLGYLVGCLAALIVAVLVLAPMIAAFSTDDSVHGLNAFGTATPEFPGAPQPMAPDHVTTGGVSPAFTSPYPLVGATMVYDVADGYDVLFGGQGNGGYSSSTWTFENGKWSNISATAGTPPSPRVDMSMAYDTADGYVLAYGGSGSTDCGDFGTACTDTWEFHAGQWTLLDPSFDPVCYRTDPTICGEFPGGSNPITYDTSIGSVLLFDGYTHNSEYVTATWSYRADVWTQLNLTPAESPPPQGSEEMAYDAAKGVVVLFGGGTEGSSGLSQNATWFFQDGLWTNETANYTTAPTPRTSFGFTYDSTDAELVLFGGDWAICRSFNDVGECNSYVSGLANDTWTFGVSGWTNVTPGVGPAPRDLSALADDPNLGGVLLFGGNSNATTGADFLGDTWSWTAATDAWTAINAPTPLASPIITANPNPAGFGKPVQFSSTESGGFLPYTYSWSFGDGGTGGNLSNITHAYTTNGPFRVVLSVTDGAGERSEGTLNISILLQARINASATGGAPPLRVNFTATAVGGTSPYSFSWNFGDGSSTSEQTSTAHTFNRSGTFTVILTVTDGQGHQSSAQVQICAGKCGNTGFLGLPGDYGYFVVGGAMAALVAVFAILGIARRQGRDDGQAGSRSRVDQSPPVDDGPIEILQPGEVDPAEDLV
jgi:PKD repeat protein